MSEIERFQIFLKYKIKKKVFLQSDIIAPTGLKPSYLSGYSEELSAGWRRSWGWEISHKRFEISGKRIMEEIREVSAMFKETHSIHAHVSFELPKNYVHEKEFLSWFKHANDYLYLSGLEEGLHGNRLVNLANDKKDLNLRELLENKIDTNSILPQSLNGIDRTSFKFLSMGLRGGNMYGHSSIPGNVRLGLELRDTTRDLNKLDSYISNFGEALATYRWESLAQARKELLEKIPRLTTSKVLSLGRLENIIPPKWAKYFYDISDTLAIPLIEYENGIYFNYELGHYQRPTAEQIKDIQTAREAYVNALKNLKLELEQMKKNGQSFDRADVAAAIKMSLSEWAKSARVSKLYKNL